MRLNFMRLEYAPMRDLPIMYRTVWSHQDKCRVVGPARIAFTGNKHAGRVCSGTQTLTGRPTAQDSAMGMRQIEIEVASLIQKTAERVQECKFVTETRPMQTTKKQH